MALGKKTGGRRPGTPNKANAAKAADIAASGLTPLDYLLKTLRNEAAEPHARFEAAKAAAPYCHPRLAAVEHSGDVGLSHRYVARVPDKAKDAAAWQNQHGPSKP